MGHVQRRVALNPRIVTREELTGPTTDHEKCEQDIPGIPELAAALNTMFDAFETAEEVLEHVVNVWRGIATERRPQLRSMDDYHRTKWLIEEFPNELIRSYKSLDELAGVAP